MCWTSDVKWGTRAYAFLLHSQMCFEWFTKGQHDLESDVQQQLFKEKILKLESYEITMNGTKNLFWALDQL